MRKLLLYFLLLTTSTLMSAQVITQDKAMEIASSFLSKSASAGIIKSPAQHQLSLAYAAKATPTAEPCFYVFNQGKGSGYVIVAGDERAYDVLGYSDNGSFDINNMSPEAKSWIQTYQDEIEYARNNNIRNVTFRQSTTSTYNPVAPLLGELAWNQDSPYNDLCPVYSAGKRCATGCVATAMAQIMRYHQWPETGNDTHSYKPSILNGKELKADFGQTTYDWTNMLMSYDANSSDVSRQAVALLMLHCGISVDMEYSSSSGALVNKVPYAMTHYFGYDKGMALRNRSNYSIDEWLQIIHNELSAGRPVYITGFSSLGGHAFVCDGCDSNEFVHINWGWGKMSNGYFRTTALTPASQGIGGSNGGFNYKQAIITGIEKPNEHSDADVELISEEGLAASASQIDNGGATNITLRGKLSNAGWQKSTYNYGLMLLSQNNDTVKVIADNNSFSLAVDSTAQGPDYGSISLGTLADGEYKLYPVCRTIDGTQQWNRIRDSYIGYPNYLNVNVYGGYIHFKSPNYFNLKVKNAQVPQKIVSGVAANMKMTVVNNGDVEYYGEIKATIKDKTTKAQMAISSGYVIDINPGDSAEISFNDTYTLASGDYNVNFVDDDNTTIGDDIAVTVSDAPSKTAVLQAAEQLSFADNNNVDRENMNISSKITCTQGIFGGQVYVFIYDSDETKEMGCLNPQYMYAETGDTVKVDFNGPFENGVPGTKYVAKLVKYDGTTYSFISSKDKGSCLFTLTSSTGINDITTTDGSTDMTIYDIRGCKVNGRSLNELPHGLYIIKQGKSEKKYIK